MGAKGIAVDDCAQAIKDVLEGNQTAISHTCLLYTSVKARFAGGTFVTPWRSIQIAPKAVGLINSGLILNLNEPCKINILLLC